MSRWWRRDPPGGVRDGNRHSRLRPVGAAHLHVGRTVTGGRLAEIRQRADEATAGPWFFSYSAVCSAPKVAEHDAFWTDERMEDGHSYERYVQCEACGGSCKRAMEAIDAHFAVASLQPSFGDTPTGQRLNDGKFIANAREDVPWLLAEVERLRQGIWDAYRILGFDTDGDATPATLTSDIVALIVGAATEHRADYDAALQGGDLS